MKKIIALILAVGLIVSVYACAGQESETSASVSSASSSMSSGSSSSGLQSSWSANRKETLKIEPFEYPEEILTMQEMYESWKGPALEIPAIEKYDDEIKISGIGYLPPVTNETPLEKLLFVIGMYTVIETNVNCDDRYPVGSYSIAYSDPRILDTNPDKVGSDPIRYLPINFLRQTQPGCYYTVQKVEGGGYAYFFYERLRDISTLEYKTDDLTDVYRTGCVYMEKALQKSDFDSIQIGSTIDEVMAVDNAANVAKIWAQSCEAAGQKLDAVLSKHLLKDGLLVYKYEYEGDMLVVTKIDFSEDFIFSCPMIIDYETREAANYPKYFEIFPQDYPQ